MHGRDAEQPNKAGQRTAAERRDDLRVDVEGGLRSDHGRVVDFSLHGVRILSDRRWEERVIHRVCISSANRTLVIDARCVWCRQEGLRDHLIGLIFDRVSEAQAETIQALLEDAGTPML